MISAKEIRLLQQNNQDDMDFCDKQVRSCIERRCVGIILKLHELKLVEKTTANLIALGYKVKIYGDLFFIGWGKENDELVTPPEEL